MGMYIKSTNIQLVIIMIVTIPLQKIWHLASQHISTVELIKMAKVQKQWMGIATLTFSTETLWDHVHRHPEQKIPGGEWTCNKLSMCLKCT